MAALAPLLDTGVTAGVTSDQLKHFRAVATRYGKRAYVFLGTVTVASLRLWLSP